PLCRQMEIASRNSCWSYRRRVERANCVLVVIRRFALQSLFELVEFSEVHPSGHAGSSVHFFRAKRAVAAKRAERPFEHYRAAVRTLLPALRKDGAIRPVGLLLRTGTFRAFGIDTRPNAR